MAVADYIAFYQLLTDTELAAEKARLLKQLDSFFSSQSVGSKSYSRDSSSLRDRVGAIGQELARRSATSASGGRNPAVGFMRHDVDF